MLNNYQRLATGAIKQINVLPYKYDEKYVVDRYDQYGIQCDMMSYLRYGFIVGAMGRKPLSILDIGYGNGSFLKICQDGGLATYGTDVSNYELKYGKTIEFNKCLEKHFDVITFFDSLEHFENIDFLGKLNCNYICISLPNCSYNNINLAYGEEQADEYFKNWKHRRENEHIWHFDGIALAKTMEKYGFKTISTESIEDVIRKPIDDFPNILTAIFKKG